MKWRCLMNCTKAVIEYLLRHGPKTAHELASDLQHWSYEYIRKCVYRLHQDKRIYVHRWLRRPEGVPGDYVAAYKAGVSNDVPRPERQSNKKVTKNYWARSGQIRNATRRTADLGPWAQLLKA